MSRIVPISVLLLGGFVVLAPLLRKRFLTFTPSSEPSEKITVGEKLASYRSVAIYQNGASVPTSHGKHYAADGYYYGMKWQCVEFVKRFYHDAHGHHMPSLWGHAKDFFDPALPHGTLNEQRGMVQFHNGENTAPRPDDLLVFRGGTYGHVAVISAVRENEIEIVQQNILGFPKGIHSLARESGRFIVGNRDHRPAGWLRLPD